MSGNTIGKSFTVTTFGESHGVALGCIIDGCPPGIEISKDEIQEQIDKATKDLNLDDCTDKEKYILSYKIEGLKNISQ